MLQTSRRKPLYHSLCHLLPTTGNVIFTILMIAITLWAQSAGAITLGATTATNSTVTIPYQGSLIDDSGTPVSGKQIMAFNLYNQPTGGTPLWTENRLGTNSVPVNDGLFNVMLGSVTPLHQSLITENNVLYLGTAIGTEAEMTPRIQLGSVPYAVVADTVRDGSITTEKLADGAVTSRQYSPQIGAIRLSETVSMNLGPRLTNHTIPETEMNIPIEFPAKLMLHYSTTFAADTQCSYDVILIVNDSEKYVSTTTGSGWLNHAGNILLDVSPGNYDVSLEIHGSTCNNPQLKFVYHRTSLIYQVVAR